MNFKSIQKSAEKLHRNAIGKSAVLKIKNETYILWFNPNNGCFETTGPNMEVLQTWNTRKISVAKKWLREYYAN